MWMNVLAALITILTFAAILRKVEVRLALLAGGLVLAVASWNLQAFSDAFTKSMTTAGLLTVILPAMGFAAVMELTECDRHLVKMVTEPLIGVRPFLVPGAVLATFLINIAIPSAAGCAAAVGIILIPAMAAAGVHPAMAAAALLAGTWGSVLNPGLVHNPVIAKITRYFFDGMGRAYALVIGIIIAAGVFIGGLEAAGVIKNLIEALKGAKSAASLIGTFGPMLMAILSGSGDAATLAFNNAVTPHAAQFGMSPIDLGNLAWLGGALGRSMSPVSAACIIGAGFAGMSPFELAKRNAVPMLVAAVLSLLILGR